MVESRRLRPRGGESGAMIGAVGSTDPYLYFRPVDPTPAVAARAQEPAKGGGVTDGEGRPLTPVADPLEALTLEKRALLAQLRGDLAALEGRQRRGEGSGDAPRADAAEAAGAPAADTLTEGERKAVEELKARDREVRAHEQAHAAVGGQYAGAPTYTYQTGPDGQSYAIGGEVRIDVSPIPGDPGATAEKMRVVERAALAPAEPSPQDLKVAQTARAQALEAEAAARTEAAAERRGETSEASAAAGAAAGYAGGVAAVADAAAPLFDLAA